MLHDVTRRRRDAEDLRRAKEAAEAAAEAKSRFLATMSHEVRTPMNSVLGFAQLLQATQPTPEQREYLDNIVRSGMSLLGIIDGVLEYSQISSGSFALKGTPCSPREFTARAGNLLLPQARGKGITLRWPVDAGVPDLVLADPARIGQILAYLVSNAIKFTEQGGVEVEVTCGEPVGGPPDEGCCMLAIIVRDTGIGIMPEAATRIFQPFVQADDSMTRRYGGVGLGLPTAQKLCEMMGGGLTMTSEPGRGARRSPRGSRFAERHRPSWWEINTRGG